MKSDARTIACQILRRLDSRRQTLDRVMEDNRDYADLPDKRERALVTTLVYGVLRWRNRLDWIIRQSSRTPFEKIDPPVVTILRLGVFQLVFLDRVPDFAAVNSAVDLARQFASSRAAGFVNGVLRNIARNHRRMPLPAMEDDPVGALAVSHSFPEWLLQRWLDRYGREATVRLCDRINRIPPVTVRVNTLKAEPGTVRADLEDAVGRVIPGKYAPETLQLTSLPERVDMLEAFGRGWIQVQDEAAQLVCRFLSPESGEKVLDACAGQGGKTACLAQLMGNRGHILAVDKDRDKLRRLGGEMERLGVTCVETAAMDLLQDGGMRLGNKFDRVMADCPCSGLGVLRRNPDTRWSTRPQDLPRHHDTQVRLLDGLSGRVRPGGLLLYVVCSREPEENREVIDSFLNLHPEFDIDKRAGNWSPAAADLTDRRGFFASLPDPHGMDGFFGARLRKIK